MTTSISFKPAIHNTWIAVFEVDTVIVLEKKEEDSTWVVRITKGNSSSPISTTVDSIYAVQSFLQSVVGVSVNFRHEDNLLQTDAQSPSLSPSPTQASVVDKADGLCYDSLAVEADEPNPLPPSSGAHISKGETMSSDFRDVLQSIENTKSEAEDVLETVRSKATELSDLESSIEEKIDELGEVEDTLTRMEELTGELEGSADDFKYIMEN